MEMSMAMRSKADDLKVHADVVWTGEIGQAWPSRGRHKRAGTSADRRPARLLRRRSMAVSRDGREAFVDMYRLYISHGFCGPPERRVQTLPGGAEGWQNRAGTAGETCGCEPYSNVYAELHASAEGPDAGDSWGGAARSFCQPGDVLAERRAPEPIWRGWSGLPRPCVCICSLRLPGAGLCWSPPVSVSDSPGLCWCARLSAASFCSPSTL